MKLFLVNAYGAILKGKDLLSRLFNRYIAFAVSPPLVRSTEETLNKMLQDQCSVSRYGDGEFSLMNGGSLLFQPFHPDLGRRLKEIVNSEREKHIVCIPNVFAGLDWCAEKPRNYWNSYLGLHRAKIYKTINIKKQYYDALVTRLYMDHQDKTKAAERFAKIKQLWANQAVIIVEGVQSRLGLGNNLFDNAARIERILCPAKDAFAKYEEILREVLRHDKRKLILISLGPTATVLAYDLSLHGYQAIDIGHIDIEYEWFLQQATEKRPVRNKYIGEVPGGTKVGDVSDRKYESEIIAKVEGS